MVLMLILALILGWLTGWLVNYFADVMPVARKLYRPVCLACKTKYKWSDYLFFRNCQNCRRKRGFRAPIVQVVMTGASLLIWLFPNLALPYPLALILISYLAVVFVIDLEHRVILHPVSLTGVFLGLITGIVLRGKYSLWHGISSSILGGVVGFGVMLLFYLAGEWYVKYMSKKRGLSPDEVALGFGDVNLSGILGMVLGWPGIVSGLLIGIIAAGGISLVIILVMLLTKKYKAFLAIPYAPFLILGTIYLLYLL
jgi:leader peptidase (prepilin peptidase)/N-methyltransferase